MLGGHSNARQSDSKCHILRVILCSRLSFRVNGSVVIPSFSCSFLLVAPHLPYCAWRYGRDYCRWVPALRSWWARKKMHSPSWVAACKVLSWSMTRGTPGLRVENSFGGSAIWLRSRVREEHGSWREVKEARKVKTSKKRTWKNRWIYHLNSFASLLRKLISQPT